MANELTIQKLCLFISKPFCFKSVKTGTLGQKEYPLRVKELTLICHCKELAKDVDGQRSIAWSSGLLKVIVCFEKIGKKENEERDKGKKM